MTTLGLLRDLMTEFLVGKGVRAVSAWPREDRTVRLSPLAVVRVKEITMGDAGFQNYLGEVFDQGLDAWVEEYGGAFSAAFGIALYSPEADGEEGCREVMDQVAEALQRGGPGGLVVEKWSLGEIGFHRDSGMFRGEITARAKGVLTERRDTDGVFLEFTVKGGLQLW